MRVLVKVSKKKIFFPEKPKEFNPFHPSVTFDAETSHLICIADQMIGFYMKCNTGLKWVKQTEFLNLLLPFSKSLLQALLLYACCLSHQHCVIYFKFSFLTL